jgi:hypothetical protein
MVVDPEVKASAEGDWVNLVKLEEVVVSEARYPPWRTCALSTPAKSVRALPELTFWSGMGS